MEKTPSLPAPPAEDPAVELTLAQENAIDAAENYLDMSGFSRSGLIEQLEFEGFATAQAERGVQAVGY